MNAIASPEFSRTVDIRQADGRELRIGAADAERAALAGRFGLVRIDRLEANVALVRNGRIVEASGTMWADFVQSCAVSAEDLPVSVEQDLSFRFVPERRDHSPDEEIEIAAENCDEIEYSGTTIDVGEAVAQSLALAIDPFATGPTADKARREAGLMSPEDSGPFAALKGLHLGDRGEDA